MSRVRIIALHFVNCEVNSSYRNCKVVNHEKNAKQFLLSQGKVNYSCYIFHLISKLYPHFTHPLHNIIKRNIAYTQSSSQNAKKYFSILQGAKLLAALHIFIAK